MSEFRPVRAVIGQMRAIYLQTFIWFWAIVGVGWAIAATVVIGIGDAEISLWHWFGTAPAKYFLMVLAIIATAIYLPVFVGHGVTRRQFARGSTAFFGLTALAFGAIVLVGYLLELALHAATGHLGPAGGTYPVSSALDGLGVFARYSVIHAAFACTGALLGATFYRFGPWGGILLVPVCAAPGFVADFFLGNSTDRAVRFLDDLFGAGSPHVAIGLLIGTALLGLGLAMAYLVVRDVPIRKVTG